MDFSLNIAISVALERIAAINKICDDLAKMKFVDEDLNDEYKEFYVAVQKLAAAESNYLASQDVTFLE